MNTRARSVYAVLVLCVALLFAILVLLIAHFGFGAVWESFGSNLVAEVIGILLVVFFVDRLLQTRERERWAPARKIIIKSLARAYRSLFNAANHCVNLQSVPPGSLSATINPEVFRLRLGFWQQAQHDLERAQITIDLYSPALDSSLLSKISMFLNAAEELSRKLRFFIQFYNPEYANNDLISEPPFTEMDEIHEIVVQLRQEYEEVFADRRVDSPGLLSPEDLKAVWRVFEQSEEGISFEIEGYEYKQGRVACVLDLDALRRINTNNFPHDARVYVFESYH